MRDLPGWAARLRAERRERLWTQRDMARQLAEAADAHNRLPERESLIGMIKDWEAGRHQPKDPYRVLYSKAFGIEEAELFGEPQTPVGRSPAEILNALLRQPDPLRPATGSRRRRLGQSTIENLTARVHGVRLADDVIAGKDLIRPAFRELDAAVRAYRQSTYTEAVGRALLSIIGETAQIAGWVASDAGEHQKAAHTYRLGIRAAHEAGDRTLESNLIGSLAYQVANVGDPHEATELARTAVEVAGPSARDESSIFKMATRVRQHYIDMRPNWFNKNRRRIFQMLIHGLFRLEIGEEVS
ncbi:hypothetical protein [Microbispora siamensis]|nr:hypothetical protein [Microbispora siamensis]